MASTERSKSTILEEITSVVDQHLGNKKREIKLVPDEDFEGAEITRVEIDIEAKETHDHDRMTELRIALAKLFQRRKDLIAPQITFRARMQAHMTGGGNLAGPDVTHIRKMIEKMRL
jgi:hypothetical protein